MKYEGELFRETADFAPVGIAVIDACGVTTYVNSRLAEIIRRAPESLLGQPLQSILVPDADESTREDHQYRCRVGGEDGSPRILDVVVRWMIDNDSRRTGAVAIIDDSTGQEPAGFDVNDLIRATVPPLVEQGTGVTLSLRLAEPPATVHLDPAQLADALRFLTFNAVEALPRGGEITIVAAHVKDRPAALPDGEFVHISVMDNGRFTAKAGAPRAGLGLTATCGIVDRAGGRMSIVAAPDSGMTIHLYVPSAPAGHSSPPGDEGNGDSRGTLLVVDDNDDLRLLATRLLTKAGYEVLTAPGGIEAMAILRNRSFDCLVTDIAMPEMGGIDLAENASAIAPDLPIVFVSGFVGIPQGPGGQLPENAHSISKPYTPEALAAAVRRAIRARLRAAT